MIVSRDVTWTWKRRPGKARPAPPTPPTPTRKAAERQRAQAPQALQRRAVKHGGRVGARHGRLEVQGLRAVGARQPGVGCLRCLLPGHPQESIACRQQEQQQEQGLTSSRVSGARDQKGCGPPAPSSPATSCSAVRGPGMPPAASPSPAAACCDQRCSMAWGAGSREVLVPTTAANSPAACRRQQQQQLSPGRARGLSPHPAPPARTAPPAAGAAARAATPRAAWTQPGRAAAAGSPAPVVRGRSTGWKQAASKRRSGS